MSKVIAFLYKHGKAMTSAVMLVTLGVTMMAGALLSYTSAEAATVTSLSDLISESAPSSASNHTITFTAQTAAAASASIVLTFDAGFNMNGVDFADMDLSVGGSDKTLAATCSGATWGAVLTGQTVTFTSCSGAIASGNIIIVEIGKNASTGGAGDTQIVSPATSNASYSLYVQTKTGATPVDDGTTYVAIVPTVELTAEVAPYFFFKVKALPLGTYDGRAVSSASLDGLANFGVLSTTAVVMGSSLSARTNATNGFNVTLEQNHNMLASSGADIDSFADGAATADAAWAAPTGTLGNELTYGHLGFHTTDQTEASLTASANFFGLSGTTQKDVFGHSGAADGVTEDIGTAKVLYKVQVSALQEVGRYENRLMYIGTATF